MIRIAFIYSFIIFLLFSCRSGNEKNLEINGSGKSEFNKYSGFTSEQSRLYHKQIRDSSLTWKNRSFIWLNGNGDLARYAFLHLPEFQKHSILHKGKESTHLTKSIRPEVGNFITSTRLGKIPLKEYVKNDEVDGLVILHHGNIVFEAYPRMYQEDHHIWFSVSKVLVSTAIGIMEDNGIIDVSKPIDFYFNGLKETGWEGVPVIDILSMSSGIDCPEIYTLPDAECYFTTREMYGWPDTDKASTNPIDAFNRLSSRGPSGQVFEYTSVNTMLLTILIEKLTGENYRDFIQREIWNKMGTESVGFLLNGAYGRDGSWLGINSTLRDMARFGLLFTPTGRNVDQPVISDELLAKIQIRLNKTLRTKSWFSDELKYNGYQWDEIYDDGDFLKWGHCGQGIYISPSKDLVIAFFGTKSDNFEEHQLAIISRQMVRSDLFNN